MGGGDSVAVRQESTTVGRNLMHFQSVPDHSHQYHLVVGRLDKQESWAHPNHTVVDCLQRWLQQIFPSLEPFCKVNLPLLS